MQVQGETKIDNEQGKIMEIILRSEKFESKT